MILLDTCGLLWLAHDQERVSEETLQRIDEAAVVYVSAITAFEIGLKYRASKLVLPVPSRDWFEQVVTHHDISIIDIDAEICLRATELPDVHKDPCDRFIIATALIRRLPVVTADRRFEEYGVAVMI